MFVTAVVSVQYQPIKEKVRTTFLFEICFLLVEENGKSTVPLMFHVFVVDLSGYLPCFSFISWYVSGKSASTCYSFKSLGTHALLL